MYLVFGEKCITDACDEHHSHEERDECLDRHDGDVKMDICVSVSVWHLQILLFYCCW